MPNQWTGPEDPVIRFSQKVLIGDGCWEWVGAKANGGYGTFMKDNSRRLVRAHRWAYEYFVGPIGDGLHIDHLCKNPPCCNPSHLEPVTPWENNRRSESTSSKQMRQTHCMEGHPFSGSNLRITRDGRRRCRECDRVKGLVRCHIYRARLRAARPPKPDICKRGHEMTPENTRWRNRTDRPNPTRLCIACDKARESARGKRLRTQ